MEHQRIDPDAIINTVSGFTDPASTFEAFKHGELSKPVFTFEGANADRDGW
jgi:hypothetical protein